MEPTSAELEGFSNVDDIYTWSGLSAGRAKDALHAVLGQPSNMRIAAAIPVAVFRTMVAGWHVPDLPPANSSSPATPAQQASAHLFLQACRLKMGLPWNLDPPPPQVQHAQQQQQLGGSGLGGGGAVPNVTLKRVVKMSSVADQTMEQEITSKSSREVNALTKIYMTKLGGEPPPEEEPTGDQIAAVEALVNAELPPAPDFALFGPFGEGTQRKLKFTQQCIQADGSFLTKEIVGPPNVSIWSMCMMVLRVVSIMLEIVEPQRTDDYKKKIEYYARLYGEDCWGLIYQADVEMRTKEFLKIKRRADWKLAQLQAIAPQGVTAVLSSGETKYDPDKPWDFVYYKAVNGGRADSFWGKHVSEPCVMLLSRLRREEELIHDHHRHPGAGSQSSPSGPGGAVRSESGVHTDASWSGASRVRAPRAKPQARERSRTPGGNAQKDASGKFITNKKGLELCDRFQSGVCRGGNPCPSNSNRAHQCCWCLQQHPGESCGNPNWSYPETTNSESGKGKAGKGGKGGKGKSQGKSKSSGGW